MKDWELRPSLVEKTFDKFATLPLRCRTLADAGYLIWAPRRGETVPEAPRTA